MFKENPSITMPGPGIRHYLLRKFENIYILNDMYRASRGRNHGGEPSVEVKKASWGRGFEDQKVYSIFVCSFGRLDSHVLLAGRKQGDTTFKVKAISARLLSDKSYPLEPFNTLGHSRLRGGMPFASLYSISADDLNEVATPCHLYPLGATLT